MAKIVVDIDKMCIRDRYYSNILVTYRSKPSKHKINMKKNSGISHQLNNMYNEISILCARFLEIALAISWLVWSLRVTANIFII